MICCQARVSSTLASPLPSVVMTSVGQAIFGTSPLISAHAMVFIMKTIACADIRGDVPKIACPTLVITTEGSGLASVDETRAWQQIIPNSELLVLPGNSYHVAASHAVQCAQATVAFIERRASGE